MVWDGNSERELWADRCYSDFFTFCDYALGYGTNPEFYWWAPRVHKPFCDWLQAHGEAWLARRANPEAGWTRLMVNVVREFGKSMIATKAFPLWLQLHDPDLSCYIGSSTVSRAQGFYEPLQTYLSGDDPHAQFCWLYGVWYDKTRAWTAYELVHAARIAMSRSEPSFSVWGIETGITSTHPDIGIIDDPIDYDLMKKDASWLEKVNSHLQSLTPIFKRNGLFIYVGTRYHNIDPIGEAIHQDGIKTASGLPDPSVTIRDDGLWHYYYMPGRDSAGKPTYPENWPEERMKDFERKNSLMYAAQILLDPNTGAHVPLTRKQVESLWINRESLPQKLITSVHLDTAFKSRENTARGDWSVIVVWGHAIDGSGNLYFLEGYGSNRWRVEDFNDQLIIVLQRLRSRGQWPFVLTDENEIAGKTGTWELTLQNWCHTAKLPSPRVQLFNRQNKKKIARILSAVPFWIEGRVRLVRSAPGVDNLVDQMLQIGISPHDDWADAAADVFHKDLYAPSSIQGYQDTQPSLFRPWDQELLGDRSGEPYRALYDDLEGSPEPSDKEFYVIE